jgi:hypothetical protein
MILTYHDELLRKSIPQNYFDDLSQFEYVNNELLSAGVQYPDIPCNDIVITKPNNKVKYLNYNTCRSLLPLLYLFNEEGYGIKQTVQSHRGRQAIGHSMTYDPSVKMIDLRQKILRRLEILYMLALEDDSLITKCKNDQCDICYKTFFSNYTCLVPEPNIFWVGQILHCIQDSYSRVHTIRTPLEPTQHGGEPPTNPAGTTNTGTFSNKERDIPSFKLVKMIGDLIDTTQLQGVTLNTKEDIVAFLIKNITHPELQKIIQKNPNEIGHIFKLTLFFKNQKKRIVALYGNETSLPSEKNKNSHKSSNVKYPYLQSFRYIGHQKKCGKSFHMSYDTKKENTTFEPFILENCSEVLKMFKRHLLADGDKPLGKIEEMISYVANNVFPIEEGYQDKPSVEECPSNDCGCRVGGKKIRSKKRKQYRKRYVSKRRSNRKT